MIHTASTYPTTLPKTSRGSSYFHIVDPYKYCSELDLVIAVAKSKGYVLPTDYQLRMLNFYINEQKSNRIWELRDLVYVHGFNTLLNDGRGIGNPNKESQRSTIENFTKLNFKSPLQYELTRTTVIDASSARFPYLGATGWGNGNGTNSYLSTGWTQANGINWQQNSASFSVYVANNTNNIETAGECLGSIDTVAARCQLRFIPWRADNTAGIRINKTSGGLPTPIGTTTTNIGYWHGDRSASNLTTLFKDGISIGTVATASATMLSTQPIYITAFNSTGSIGNTFQAGLLSIVALGGSLGSTLQKIDYEIFTQFRTKLGY